MPSIFTTSIHTQFATAFCLFLSCCQHVKINYFAKFKDILDVSLELL